jgi:hypothetical protein
MLKVSISGTNVSKWDGEFDTHGRQSWMGNVKNLSHFRTWGLRAHYAATSLGAPSRSMLNILHDWGRHPPGVFKPCLFLWQEFGRVRDRLKNNVFNFKTRYVIILLLGAFVYQVRTLPSQGFLDGWLFPLFFRQILILKAFLWKTPFCWLPPFPAF